MAIAGHLIPRLRSAGRAGVVTLLVALAVGLGLTALVTALNVRDEGATVSPTDSTVATRSPVDLIARGEYLTRAGDCVACHTARGGAAYAGGRGIDTPFGTVFAPNLTPDRTTGLGDWSADDFWRALHNGRSRNGRLLYPAFPYTNYTRVVRADADAMYAYLRSLPAVVQPSPPHEVGFPFNLQASLAVWRALYFEPGTYRPDAARPANWNRGAYLVEGLGHCNACHSSRNALGATAGPLDLAGGLIPVQNWYAPSLTSAAEASVADWDLAQIVQLLKTGTSGRATVMGPMSEVVKNATQFLSDDDLLAMATFLKSLPVSPSTKRPAAESSAGSSSAAARLATNASGTSSASATALSPTPVGNPPGIRQPDPRRADAATRGAKLYETNCLQCHGESGEGVPGAYPPLAGSRAVTMDPPANLVHIVHEGGFPPSTAGNPRPFGMPPFATRLSSDEVADLLTHIRNAWGNQAGAVSALEVNRYRSAGRQ